MTSQTAPLPETIATAEASDLGSEHSDDFVWFNRIPNPLRQPVGAIAWVLQVLMGIVTLLVLLAILAAVPVLNLIALGYLLEAEGTVGRSGKLRQALPLLPIAMRIGSILLGVLACLFPVMLLADVAADARLIAPRGTATWFWLAALVVVSIVMGIHIVLALARGGSLGCFVRPLKNVLWLRGQLRSGVYWSRFKHVQRKFFAALKPWHHFSLGARGFLGTGAWLALPTALYGVWWHSNATWIRLLTLLAGVSLVPLLAWVPMLQVRLAVENRWPAMFEVRNIHELFRRSPLSWLIAIVALYALSIPLFLYSLRLRLHVPLHLGIWWDLTFVSIACTIPARAALGWAYHRSQGREPAWFGWVWFCRLSLAGLLAMYVWLLFYTPLTHDAQPWQLEHHSLLLPIPW